MPNVLSVPVPVYMSHWLAVL